MTEPTRRRHVSVWPLWAWVMTGVSAVAVGAGAIGGVLSPSIVLDIISFWPGLVGAFLVAAALWPVQRRGRRRLGAVLPLLMISWLASGSALHLAGWNQLPSAAADLVGPDAGLVTTASLRIATRGTLALGGHGAGPLYRVEMVRRGGEAGPPEALERVDDGVAVLDVRPQAEVGWFRFAGWEASVAENPTWQLEAEADVVELDLATLRLAGLRVEGAGRVDLPRVGADPVPVRLQGSILLTVPDGTAAEVTGQATVPTTWERLENGARAPVDGPGYVIEVIGGATVEITER